MNQNPENRNPSDSARYNNRNPNTPTGANNPNSPNSPRRPAQGQNPPRRALTEEERRRIEAARRAAAQRRQENPGAAPVRQPRPTQPRSIQQGNAQGHRQRAALVNDPRQNAEALSRPVTQQSQASRQRAKRDVKPNGGLIIFLALAAAVTGISVWQITRNPKKADPETPKTAVAELADVPDATEIGGEENAVLTVPDAAEEPADPAAQAGSADEALPPDVPSPDPNAVNLTLYDTETVSNSAVDEGNLILVNKWNPYAKADTVALASAYDEENKIYKVSSTSLSLAPDALAAFRKLAADFSEETGSHDLLLNSAHRTVAEQQDVWDYYASTQGDEYVHAYVASPGESEHHTGLACDLTFYTDDGQNIPIPDYPTGQWIPSHAADYGFILRYPEGKVDITGISNEPWHFRYVGIPHSTVCEKKNWCLEEYVENIQKYTAEGTLLYITNSGDVYDAEASEGLPTTNGWLIYHVPKDSGSSTSFKVIRGYDYTISGTNAGGFIVTVYLG